MGGRKILIPDNPFNEFGEEIDITVKCNEYFLELCSIETLELIKETCLKREVYESINVINKILKIKKCPKKNQ